LVAMRRCSWLGLQRAVEIPFSIDPTFSTLEVL